MPSTTPLPASGKQRRVHVVKDDRQRKDGEREKGHAVKRDHDDVGDSPRPPEWGRLLVLENRGDGARRVLLRGHRGKPFLHLCDFFRGGRRWAACVCCVEHGGESVCCARAAGGPRGPMCRLLLRETSVDSTNSPFSPLPLLPCPPAPPLPALRPVRGRGMVFQKVSAFAIFPLPELDARVSSCLATVSPTTSLQLAGDQVSRYLLLHKMRW